MKEKYFRGICFFITLFLTLIICLNSFGQEIDENLFADELPGQEHVISDPIESLNRVFFHFNDKLYFWVLRPVSNSYSAVVHKDIIVCVGNFLRNILAPIRIVNNLLQGKIHDSGVELARFVINTTVGGGGIADQAKTTFNLNAKNEDFGQSLGVYGVGEGIYICWPLFGPSNVRDTFGLIGDAFINPLTYLNLCDYDAGLILKSLKIINDTTLSDGEYEGLIEASFDPYTAMRDIYIQSRRSKIADKARFTSTSHLKIQAVTENGQLFFEKIAGLKGDSPIAGYIDLNNVERMVAVSPFFDNSVIGSFLKGSTGTFKDVF